MYLVSKSTILSLLADQMTSRIIAELGKKLMRGALLEKSFSISMQVMCFVSSSYSSTCNCFVLLVHACVT